MFWTILLSIITGMHMYVFWRATSVPFLKRHVPRKYIILAGMLLWFSFYVGRILGHRESGTLVTMGEYIGMSWMATLFLIFVCLLAVDCVTGFGLIFNHHAPSLRGLAIVIGLLFSIIALIQGLRPPVMETYDIYLADLPKSLDSTMIIAMSDLHLGSLIGEKWLKARVEQVNEQNPDLIVLCGDIFEGHGGDTDTLVQIINNLSAPLGVYAVYGNHEFHRRHRSTPSPMEKSAFKTLRNAWKELEPGLVLAGVDDLTTAHRRGFGRGRDYCAKALTNRPPGATILLSHTPWETDTAASLGVDLMICGHTHGGQIWPFDYLVKYFYPLLEGLYDVKGMHVIVCRGTGTWGPTMRLWSRGEISKIILHSTEKLIL
ncbi:MAG: metallophosphoesterase [bacterium]